MKIYIKKVKNTLFDARVVITSLDDDFTKYVFEKGTFEDGVVEISNGQAWIHVFSPRALGNLYRKLCLDLKDAEFEISANLPDDYKGEVC